MKTDPAKNLELTAKLLARLQNRLPSRSVESIASLYNNTRTDRVTGYGLTVGRYYDETPWRAEKRPAMGFRGSPEAFPSRQVPPDADYKAFGFESSPLPYQWRLRQGLAQPGGVFVDPSRAPQRFFKARHQPEERTQSRENLRSPKGPSHTKVGGPQSGGLLSHHFH